MDHQHRTHRFDTARSSASGMSANGEWNQTSGGISSPATRGFCTCVPKPTPHANPLAQSQSFVVTNSSFVKLRSCARMRRAAHTEAGGFVVIRHPLVQLCLVLVRKISVFHRCIVASCSPTPTVAKLSLSRSFFCLIYPRAAGKAFRDHSFVRSGLGNV